MSDQGHWRHEQWYQHDQPGGPDPWGEQVNDWYGQPPPPPPRPPKRSLGAGTLAGIVGAVVFALLLCTGIGLGGAALYNRANNPPGNGTTTPPSSLTPVSPGNTAPKYGIPPVFAKVGDCVQERQWKSGESMVTTPCRSGVLRIMKRFEGTTSVVPCAVYDGGGVGTYVSGEKYVLCFNRVP